MHDLAGKTILLTGASRGIGAATAQALGQAGASVIAHYGSHRQGAEQAVASIPELDRLVLGADLSRPGVARGLWRDAAAWRGRVDVLVVNAATMPTTAFDASDEEWDEGWARAVQVNLLEPASLIREAVRHFRDRDGGIVITLSSWAAQRGSAISHLGAYAASKAALANLTQTVARNYAADGILAYVVAPGIVRTRLSEASAAARGGVEAVNAALALGEMVPPEEVAELIAFLATGRCRHLTGATLDLNGASNIR
ncbi:MAG: SDR family oxidoreductase [Gaiellaceae bacterium MAG52_C11]|nr:SDR family oxidoreductase [Candidatus Gaiellasilicea maunaloa]